MRRAAFAGDAEIRCRSLNHSISAGPASGMNRAVKRVVFEKVGVGLLRTAWLNLDLVWAAALVVSSVMTLVMA